MPRYSGWSFFLKSFLFARRWDGQNQHHAIDIETDSENFRARWNLETPWTLPPWPRVSFLECEKKRHRRWFGGARRVSTCYRSAACKPASRCLSSSCARCTSLFVSACDPFPLSCVITHSSTRVAVCVSSLRRDSCPVARPGSGGRTNLRRNILAEEDLCTRPGTVLPVSARIEVPLSRSRLAQLPVAVHFCSSFARYFYRCVRAA